MNERSMHDSVMTIRTYKINAAGDSYATSETRALRGELANPFTVNPNAWPACACSRCA
jgi:hypothetical protein